MLAAALALAVFSLVIVTQEAHALTELCMHSVQVSSTCGGTTCGSDLDVAFACVVAGTGVQSYLTLPCGSGSTTGCTVAPTECRLQQDPNFGTPSASGFLPMPAQNDHLICVIQYNNQLSGLDDCAFNTQDLVTPQQCTMVWSGDKDRVITIDLTMAHTNTPSGELCAQSSTCASGSCKTATCCKVNDVDCDECGQPDGACTFCSNNFVVQNDFCQPRSTAGETCSVDSDCASGSCKGQRCCSFPLSPCTACAAGSGLCSACGSEHYLANGACVPKLSEGMTCLSDSMCASGVCRSSTCCNAGVGGQCHACGAQGACTSCTSNYYVNGITCSPKLGAAARCSASSQCLSGMCKGGRCCQGSVGSGCVSCSSFSGFCLACLSGSVLSGGMCVTQQQVGQACSSSAQCTSGHCIGGYCCEGSVYGLSFCNACSASTGLCASCDSRAILYSGNCIQSSSAADDDDDDYGGYGYGYDDDDDDDYDDDFWRNDDGGDGYGYLSGGAYCSFDSQCSSGNCAGNRCCWSAISRGCTSCSTSGYCDQCSYPYTLFGGNCVGQDDQGYSGGSYCSDDDACASNMCKDSYCCAVGTISECTACDSDGFCTSVGDTGSSTNSEAAFPLWYLGAIIPGFIVFLSLVSLAVTRIRNNHSSISSASSTSTSGGSSGTKASAGGAGSGKGVAGGSIAAGSFYVTSGLYDSTTYSSSSSSSSTDPAVPATRPAWQDPFWLPRPLSDDDSSDEDEDGDADRQWRGR